MLKKPMKQLTTFYQDATKLMRQQYFSNLEINPY